MAPAAIPSNFVLSAALIVPGTEVVAAAMLMIGVVVPVATEIAPLPVTLVTVPTVGATHDNEPAVAPAVSTFPLLVVLVAGTWRLPSPVGCAYDVAPAAMPSSLALSAADIVPGTEAVAAAMLIVGVVDPLETEIAPLPATLVTEPVPLLLNVFQSAADR